ncbi:hypothetical protein ACJRO7_004778 [Eucalyptus globulus]|uniref:NmrA-like domain-containing protein n=1 Tax=Eucalyptus globulus TaxID=34317 RepID=A0ABD3IY37_EUCGL
MAREAEPSRILIFGGTGYIGKHIARASVAFGHPTCIYARPPGPQTRPSNLDLWREFRSTGICIIEGELDEYEKIVASLKQVDIVISALAYPQVPDQLKIIDAIVAVGNIKRFVPSDFGCEEDKIMPLPPFEEVLEKKRKIRRATEATAMVKPKEDVGKYTIKVANDPRACNRVVSYRPKPNIISQHQLISLWEEKTGRSFKRVYVPEKDLVKLSQTLPPPENIPVSILHSVFVKGDLMSYEIDDDDLEVSTMYPEMQLTTIDQLLDIFLTDPPEPARAAFG